MGTRSGNPLWKNDKSGGTPISAEALNRIEDALDSEDVYISELLEDSDSAINMFLKANIGSQIESYLDANPPAAAPDASTTVKGLVKLAGDLGGTADLPTVPGLAGKADALGPDDNYVTDAEKAALHTHANAAALAAVSGTNTGDQTLPTWSTLSGKPAVIGAGADATAARTAIGAGTSSLVLGTSAGTAAAGNDARLTDARTPTEHTHPVSAISDSTTVGRAVVTAADQASARTAIGAGTSSLVLGTTAGTAAAGNDTRLSDARTPTAHNHAATEITSGTLAAARLPAATDTAQGAVELATTAETTTGTDTTRAVTPAGVKASLDARAANYATAAQGALAATALQPATGQTINAQTGTSYTLVASDAGKVVTLTNAAAIMLTVPGNVFTTGQRVDCLVLGAGMVTLVGSGITLNQEAGLSLVSRAQFSAFTVLFTSATTAVVVGGLA